MSNRPVARCFATLCASLFLVLATADGWSADLFKGKDLYMKQCKRCHGLKGDSQFVGVPNINWRGGAQSGLLKPDNEVMARIQKGRNACPSFKGILSEQDILDIIAHMRVAYQ